MAQKAARRITQFNDEEFNKIYQEELEHFDNHLYPDFEQLVNKLDQYSDIPITELAILIKNQRITLSNDVLDIIKELDKQIILSNYASYTIKKFNIDKFFDNDLLLAVGTVVENNIDIIRMQEFPNRFVDMNILHAIAQNKQVPIIVVAGGDHIHHVIQRLQQCGYVVKKSVGEEDHTICPSTLDLETVLNNLERADGMEDQVGKKVQLGSVNFSWPIGRKPKFFTYRKKYLAFQKVGKQFFTIPSLKNPKKPVIQIDSDRGLSINQEKNIINDRYGKVIQELRNKSYAT